MMKKQILALTFALVAAQSHSETVITPQGNYTYSQAGSTTYVTGPSTNPNMGSALVVAVPVRVNPVTGIGMVQGPNGSYLVQRSGSTTTVIQTSKGR